METKRYKKAGITALILCILPLATFIPILFHISLTDTVRSVWAGLNMLFIVLGLILSFICVRSRESRSMVNIISTVISVLWVLLIAGIILLALFINCIQ